MTQEAKNDKLWREILRKAAASRGIVKEANKYDNAAYYQIIAHTGMSVVYVEVDPETLAPDEDRYEEEICRVDDFLDGTAKLEYLGSIRIEYAKIVGDKGLTEWSLNRQDIDANVMFTFSEQGELLSVEKI